MNGRARASGLLLAPVLAVWAVAVAAGGARADDQHLFRASAEADAVHGFYDHEHLVPVPLFDLSVPHAEASLEPGPSTAALGSFLWEPQGAELSAIFCQLSNGQVCGLPNYPFMARATYPRSGEPSEPPSLEVGDPAPVQVAGADEHASATAARAAADAVVLRLAAIPMNAPQAAAARQLALVIGSAGERPAVPTGGLPTGLPGASPQPSSSGAAEPTPWLLSVASATADSSVSAGGLSASSGASSEVHGLALLGGTITIRTLTGDATAAIGGSGRSSADARWAGLEVGGMPATIGPDGIRILDHTLGAAELRMIQDAVNHALSQAGLTLSRGSHTVSREGDALVAEAWALSVDYRAQNVPPGAPQGAGGADVLQLPLGYARATAEEVSFPGPPTGLPPIPPATNAPPPYHGGGGIPPPPAPPGGDTGPAVPPGGGLAPPPPPPPRSGGNRTAPRGRAQVRVVPASGRLARGIPAASLVLLGLAGVAFVVGMTGLKTMESLTEGASQ